MCIKSKAVRLILLWSFLAYIGYYFSFSSSIYLLRNNTNLLLNASNTVLALSEGGFIALLLLFLPLSGWIGDVKCGRYKTVKGSLVFLIIMSVIPIAVSCVNLVLYKYPTLFMHSGAKAVTVVVLVCLVVISLSGFVSFLSNVIPFAMDQLRDAPAQESSIFIYWYVWTIYLCLLVNLFVFGVIFNQESMFKFNPENPLNFSKPTSITVATFMILVSILVLACLVAFRVMLQRKERWFNTEPYRVNPYKLVYRVTKFAFQHKLPIRRSAFTYCEDELPSRLDLGKSKYGGPFTTEEVEDVKVFYEILKLLIALGPILYLTIADDSTLSLGIQLHNYVLPDNLSSNFDFGRTVLLYNGMLSTLVIVVTVPLYLSLCRCSNLCSLPALSSLRRLELGAILMLLNMVFKLGVNIAAHIRNEELNSCTLILGVTVLRVFSPLVMALILIIQQVLSGIAQMLLYTSFFEFICAQSPHSVKGMLIGLTYSIKGLFGLVALIFLTPFLKWKLSNPSCGFVYYSMNVVIAIVSFITLALVASRYKYRERDEPSKERQYAEEYYSNLQPERYYDYDDSVST